MWENSRTMTRKTIGAIIVSSLIIGLMSFFYVSDSTQPIMQMVAKVKAQNVTTSKSQAAVKIKAVDKIKIGGMIIIDLSTSIGEGFDYVVEPTPPDLRTFNGGKLIVCGTGDKNITYIFMISCALGGDSDIAVHKIKVTGAPPADVKPGEALIQKVHRWAEYITSPSKRDDALKLAQSFASMAVIIEQDTFGTVSELAEASRISNRDALNGHIDNWTPFLESIRDELKRMSKSGKLPDVKSHARVWKDISQGLKEYAETMK